MSKKVVVGTTEMFVSKESVPSGEGGRMGRGEDEVTRTVDEGALLLCISAPKDEDKPLALGGQGADGGIGELFPPLTLMAASLMGTHGERGVEKEHSLLGPTGEIARLGDGDAQVALYLLEDVDQRGGKCHSIVDGEAEAMGLAGAMIGVLPDDDDLHTVERTKVERIEDEPSGGKDGALSIFLTNKFGEAHEIVFLKFGGQLLFPAFFNSYVHNFSSFNFFKSLPYDIRNMANKSN